MNGEDLILRIERSGTDTLCLFGDLDLAAYEALRAALLSLSGPVRLEISGVTFMDSTGLRLILERLTTSPVRLVCPTSRVVRLLELSGLTELDGLTVVHRVESNLPSRSDDTGLLS